MLSGTLRAPRPPRPHPQGRGGASLGPSPFVRAPAQGGLRRFSGSWGRCPGVPAGSLSFLDRVGATTQTRDLVSISLFIRGVNYPCIVFLLLDYFVFV